MANKCRTVCSLFADPLIAAASNGHLHIIDHVLSVIEPSVPIVGITQSQWYQGQGTRALETRVYLAVAAAIKEKNNEIVLRLYKFAETRRWSLNPYDSGELAHLRGWLKSAVLSGCIKTCRTVLYAVAKLTHYPKKPRLNEELNQRWNDELFDCMCENGQVALIRSMLHKSFVTCEAGECQGGITRTKRAQHGLWLAAKHGRNEVVDLMLEYGASIKAGEPIAEAVERGRLTTMMLMLQRGARITSTTTKMIGNVLEGYRSLRGFRCRFKPLSFYLAATLAVPVGGHTREVKWLIEDVEDSMVWSARAKDMMGWNFVSEVSREETFGESL